MEQETFWTLLHSSAHWELEIFLTILQDVVLGLIVWPFVSKHLRHHFERDERESKDVALAQALETFARSRKSYFISPKDAETLGRGNHQILRRAVPGEHYFAGLDTAAGLPPKGRLSGVHSPKDKKRAKK